MPLRIITTPAGTGLTTYLLTLSKQTPAVYVLITTPAPHSWWALPHALGTNGGELLPAVSRSLRALAGTLLLDLPFTADALTASLVQLFVQSGKSVVLGIEAGLPGSPLPATRRPDLTNGCGICATIARNADSHFLNSVRDKLAKNVPRIEAFVGTAVETLLQPHHSRFLLLRQLMLPGFEHTIDSDTLSLLWKTTPDETTNTISAITATGLGTHSTSGLHIHKLVTSQVSAPPTKDIQHLHTHSPITPFLKSHFIRLLLAIDHRKALSAITYDNIRGRALEASQDIATILEQRHIFSNTERLDFCIDVPEFEEGLRILKNALYKAGVYSAGDVVEEMYQIYGRLFLWRGRNAVVRRFLIGLELFGGAVRRNEKPFARRIGIGINA